MTQKELKRAKIDSLPGSLEQAVELLEKNDIIKDALGEHILNEFIATKKNECDKYRTYVTPLEMEMYLDIH
jgi:glutamine synthetase